MTSLQTDFILKNVLIYDSSSSKSKPKRLDYSNTNNYKLPKAETIDFNTLYNYKEDEGWEHFSPRLLYRLYVGGLEMLHMAYDPTSLLNDTLWLCPLYNHLPECAQKYYEKNTQWRMNFQNSMRRILLRLLNGIGFKPNCGADEMCVNALIRWCNDIIGDMIKPNEEDWMNTPFYRTLKEYPKRDFEIDSVLDFEVEDLDIEYLFDRCENPQLKEAMLKSDVYHPKLWFKAFHNNRFYDYLPKKKDSKKNVTTDNNNNSTEHSRKRGLNDVSNDETDDENESNIYSSKNKKRRLN